MKVAPKNLKLKKDDRGWSVEILKRNEIKQDIRYVYLMTSKPGAIRGNHYHKRRAEWLCVLHGKAKFIIVDNKTGKKTQFTVSGDKPRLVDMPTNVTHTIKNIGKEQLYILEITNMEYSKKNHDTFRLSK